MKVFKAFIVLVTVFQINFKRNNFRHKRCGFNPWVGKGEGRGNPLWYSYLENPMDKEPGGLEVHRAAQNWTQLRMRWLDGITDSMASRTRWTWVWVNSGRRWGTGRPGVLQFMGSQGVRHSWVTELNWSDLALRHLLFLALLGLHCRVGFSWVVVSRATRYLWCAGFSLRCLSLLQSTEHWFRSYCALA